MDPKRLGLTIAELRKAKGLTQIELAKRLNVTDKAVSKWETGLGFPEVGIFPELASIFGVTVDFLMTGKRRGIAIAGNMLTDIVKTIDTYPEKGMLANITHISQSVGGCVPNVSIDLAKIDPALPLMAIGSVGDDANGRYVLSQLQRHNINTEQILISEVESTGFCDVMSLPTGERTFFHAKGSNRLFCPEDVNIASLQCNILHIGYIFLLDSFDAADPEYGTVMARFLRSVQKSGIKTSIDVVSDSTGNYPEKVIPALKYLDYIIFNEIECGRTWEMEVRNPDGSLNIAALHEAMQKTMAAGVKEKVVVHSKEAGLCLSADGSFTVVPALSLPEAEIQGSVGAGDAFCAGSLYGIYSGFSDQETLEFASAAAACSLFADNAVDGMRSKNEIYKLQQCYERRTL